jgi:hypothetical protein
MFVVILHLCVCSQSVFNTRKTPVIFLRYFGLNFLQIGFLNVDKNEHAEVGHRSDLETVISQWENLRSRPVMARWKDIDLNIMNMVLAPNIKKL